MGVDVSKECDFINQAILGGDVRKSLSGGIKKVADEVNKFEDDTTDQQTKFIRDTTKRQDDYENKITKQQNDYEDNITSNQNTYEDKVNTQWSEYKEIMDEDEASRKSNEHDRLNNENERTSNEDIRKQNEVIRQNNETERIESEQTRKSEFEAMKHVDATLELTTARGTYSTLGDRLDNSDDENLCTEELISIDHNFNCYPVARLISTNYGAGIGKTGEVPAGGAESYLVNSKICYMDKNSIKIYVSKNHNITSPVLEKVSDNKYIVTSSSETETKSILINLTEVA
ncbi:hypothetical protein [Clostridium tyrobutyricum]|uniref:hypothetical protein n=1 Tax=Clostridium tyrobutyricum TaxID=1519 RepID=UPI00057D33F8|nr:hypothetical protein [Clostridium tyrobutyricum]